MGDIAPSLWLPPQMEELYKNPQEPIFSTTSVLVVYDTITLPDLTNPGEVAKVSVGTVETDNMSWWTAATTRYTPKAAGWYTALVFYVDTVSPLGAGEVIDIGIYRNGISIPPYVDSTTRIMSSNNTWGGQYGSSWVAHMNGTTDYLEVFANCTKAGRKGRVVMSVIGT